MIDLQHVWLGTDLPVLFKRSEGSLLVRVPYDPTNRAWLTAGKQSHRLTWNPKLKCFEAPRSRFDRLAYLMAARLGEFLVVQPIDKAMVCNDSCMNAVGLDCVCGCLGKNHGRDNAHGWAQYIQEAGLAEHYDRQYAYRLMKAPTVKLFTCLVDRQAAEVAA